MIASVWWEPYRLDMRDRLVQPGHDLDRDDGCRGYSVAPIDPPSRPSRAHPRPASPRRRALLQPASSSVAHQWAEMGGGARPHRRAASRPSRRRRCGEALLFITIARAMARSAPPCRHGHGSCRRDARRPAPCASALDSRHQALARRAAPPRRSQPSRPCQDRAHRRTVARRHELDRVARAVRPPRAHRCRARGDRASTVRKLSEPARRIAALPALQAQSAGIGGDVRSAFEDDGDDAERRGDRARRSSPFGCAPACQRAGARRGRRSAATLWRRRRPRRRDASSSSAKRSMKRLAFCPARLRIGARSSGIGGEDRVPAQPSAQSADLANGDIQRLSRCAGRSCGRPQARPVARSAASGSVRSGAAAKSDLRFRTGTVMAFATQRRSFKAMAACSTVPIIETR